MPGDPKECRERARECMELARTARTPEQKLFLTGLAQGWLNLAVELERDGALLKEYPLAQTDAASPEQPEKPD